MGIECQTKDKVAILSQAVVASLLLFAATPKSVTETRAVYVPAFVVTPEVTAEPSTPIATPEPLKSIPTSETRPTLEPVKPVDINDITAPEYQLVAVINSDRAVAGLKPLSMNAQLARMAKIRSLQMFNSGVISHFDDNGELFFKNLLEKDKFPYALAGENLAINNYSWNISLEEANNGLMKSPTHRNNILNKDFSEAGTGIVGPDFFGNFYYTQIFAQIKG